ncbi:MAG: hypothetical protein IJE89_01795 [Bacilli bacterium]|nr:hypothetical protein [Bacilli bacterium]
MKNSETKDFVAYEYISLNVKSEFEPLYIDCYENFGWILINNTSLIDSEDYYINNSNVNNNKLVNLKFKRDRRIKNKVELLSLQRKLESSLKEIETLEKEPYTKGIISALTIGLIGTIFLALSVFSITATNPLIISCIICGIIGLTGWFLGYFAYIKVKVKTQKENISLIEEQYNTIYDSCEQARKLID